MIKFGTSGWRDIFGEGFTFPKVRRLTQAIVDHLKARGNAEAGVVVASDYRFLAERLVDDACRVLVANDVPAFRADFAPTPAISWEILERKAAGSINFTASHNPHEYNGLKYNPDWGGPALPEDTNDIVERANAPGAAARVKLVSRESLADHPLLHVVDVAPSYLAQLCKLIDFDAIKTLKIACDPMFGAGRGFLDRSLRENGVSPLVLHDHRDVLFGGGSPDPLPEQLVELSRAVKTGGLDVGIATDGDADRFGIIDDDGSFILPNYILALLFDYLVTERGFEGGAARSVSTTHLVDFVGRYHDREVEEVPVGFKYIGRALAEDRIAIGGEESGGLSIRGHVPEKDGVLACLLACELRARRGKSFREMLAELRDRVGTLHSSRVNLPFAQEKRTAVKARFAETPTEFAGRNVERVDSTDGLKLYLEGDAWLLVRLSGTGPLIRIYAEAPTIEEVEVLTAAGERFLLGE